MNFIGHATVALWLGRDPAFVLGSMLPDFASMVGSRLTLDAARHDSELGRGIALHHRTDDVFHGTPVFTTLLHETLETLSAEGVARGTARAVAHIGTEMLIDGELLQAAGIDDAYLDALRASDDLSALFREPAGAVRFELLRARLLALGPPHDYRDPDAVLARLGRVLAGRPRLAIDADAAPIVRRSLPTLQRKVMTNMETLLADLRAGLAG